MPPDPCAMMDARRWAAALVSLSAVPVEVGDPVEGAASGIARPPMKPKAVAATQGRQMSDVASQYPR